MAARKGDDALLRFLTAEFEKEGFAIEGAHEVMGELALPAGPLGGVRARRGASAPISPRRSKPPARSARSTSARAPSSATAWCWRSRRRKAPTPCCARIAELPADLRGDARAPPRACSAKVAKPIQEERVDLPTIGPATVEGAARAGLAGIVGVAGKMLVLDRDAVIQAADAAGLFVVGVVESDALGAGA